MTRDKVLELTKVALTTVAAIGITILSSALAGNIAGSSKSGTIKKACMALGGAVIGGMVAAQAEKYIASEVDHAVKQYDDVVEAFKKAKTQTTEATE